MFIKLILIAMTSIVISQTHANTVSALYVGSKSTEAKLEFKGTVQYETTRTPLESTLRNVIEAQLEHIVGPMSKGLASAVPKGDHQVSNIKIISKTKTKITIGYSYKGTFVVQNGPTTTFPIHLVTNPERIYAKSMVGTKNPCTSEHYQSQGDFWYFWSPTRKGCKLVAGVDYVIVNAKLTRFLNTKISYPEYQNLPDEKGNITVHILFGMNDPDLSRNPLDSTDVNAINYREFRSYLVKKGYTATSWSEEKINAIAKTQDGEAPFVETIKKGKLVYRFFFGPTGINEQALAFHWFYKDALEQASIVMYSGHSGLGGHLDLDSIEQSLGETINFSRRYQIYYFDSCTSYRYYNSAYFDKKITLLDSKGTKTLDILTNGLSTAFNTMTTSNTSLAKALEKALSGNGFVSYQTLAKEIDSNNLFGINGDEDNIIPTK
jgi:hypothetical protein